MVLVRHFSSGVGASHRHHITENLLNVAHLNTEADVSSGAGRLSPSSILTPEARGLYCELNFDYKTH
jgi:hypothetical protein